MAAVAGQPMQMSSAGGQAAGTEAVMRLVVEGDFPAGSTLKVCGSIPELGSWKIDAAPVVQYDSANKRWSMLIPVFASIMPGQPGYRVEYKLALQRPGHSGWDWQPGPNRTTTLPVAPSSTTAVPGAGGARVLDVAGASTVREAWFTSRDGTGVLTHPTEGDPYLEPFAGHLKERYRLYSEALTHIEAHQGGLDAFTRSYERYGFNRTVQGGVPGISYREWAPGAQEASLIGDFNGWDVHATKCTRDEFGTWSVFLPDREDGSEAIPHDSWIKLSLVLADGSRATRVPAWIRYACYDPKLNELVGKYWSPAPEQRHAWKHPRPWTFQAADYTKVPGMPVIPCRTDWTGTVSPHEAEVFGLAEEAAVEGVTAAAAAPAATAGKTTTPTGAAPAAAAGGGHRRGRTGMDNVNVSALRTAYMGQKRTGAGAGGSAAGGGAVVQYSRPSPTAPGDMQRDPGHSGLRIYEAHVGMSSSEGKVASYRHFADNILPRIKGMGYNCVQLMAIMEHAYYGSFGYHVNQFLAPSSRFGTPEDLKYLVDTAHGMGLLIIMDCVHSHASKNVNDGLNRFDGTDHHYFHAGARGNHDLWDSRLFDYSKIETQRLLLSSLRLFVDEFRFDGFRFDGVTSMMYHHHGLSYGFSGDYNEYFGEHTDLSAVVYLMLANTVLHSMGPPVLSVAEDVSGMPTLGRPVYEGGVGFDFRLAMAVPDLWIKYLKEKSDEEWDLDALAWTLINRRWQEKCIAYAESHDQALVGDKTIAFWLMDKEMYWHMSEAEQPRHPVVDRGMALHKMIRLMTYGLGGEAWLNFMGNEFGHPEWIDFPREGNGWNYQHCRRQWNLVDDASLLYKYLGAWDGGMHHLEEQFPWLKSRDSFVSTKHFGDKVLIFDRGTASGPLVFAFNLHPTQSYTDYKVGAPCAGEWEVALDSDDRAYGGYGRLDHSVIARGSAEGWNGRPASFLAYLPARTCVVWKLKGTPKTWMS